ncbi:MAG: gluconokinase, partial [Sphingobium sp.]
PGHYMPASLLDSQLATLEPPLPEEGAMILTTNVPASELRDRALAWLG